ncbi:hypothetical protein V7024_15985 [Bacillus sp. JJ864]|uniref:hypothetical protein n=1 Tax=Bacillus sp. JJ864 TaxID=3122975 RepID=UPI002FFFCC0A
MNMTMTMEELEEQLEKDFDYVLDVAERRGIELLEYMIIIKKLGLEEEFLKQRLALRKRMIKLDEDK